MWLCLTGGKLPSNSVNKARTGMGNVMEEQSQVPINLDHADRRTFVTVIGAGVAGAALATAAGPAMAQTVPTGGIAGATEIQKPKGMGPKGMLDNRFPESYQESITKGVEVLIGYFSALNRRDLKAMANYLHFPFATFEGTDPVLVSSPEQLFANTPASMNMTLNPERFTDHDGYIKQGSYDIIQNIEPHCFDPVVCGLSLTYDRFDSNGKRLLRCEGVYSVTNIEGKWGIELMSTIFTPDMQVGFVYADAEMWANRLRLDHDISYHLADVKYEPVPQLGPSASIANHAGQPWSLGPAGKAMDQFVIKGVKTRLRFAENKTPPPPAGTGRDMDAYYTGYRKLFQDAGDGNFGFVYGRLPNSRVLHQSFNKAHQFSGAIRFTAQGELCSYNTDIGILTYKYGRWASQGSACYTTPHDRSNDLLTS